MSGARIRETEHGSSFVAECDCSGEWRELLVVEGALKGFATWNANHAIGGHGLTCLGCGSTWALGGRLEGRGLPDLISVDELLELPRLELTLLQRRLLDVSLIAEETLWARAMDSVKAALQADDQDRAQGEFTAARLMRAAHRRERAWSLLAILREHGLEHADPSALRIARLEDGHGAIYAADRGPLPVRARELEPEAERVVDLSAWIDDDDAELEALQVGRVVDLS